jgi:tRNA 2-thiouridine synthesizing protein C
VWLLFFFRAARQRRRQEGLDALLATSALTDEIGVFFVGDGVFQLLPAQRPGAVLARDYIATFKLLSLYDIDQCWLCAESARERPGSRRRGWWMPNAWRRMPCAPVCMNLM